MGASIYEIFKQSNAWDPRFQLPLCPQNNNPWTYGAYALKVMRGAGLSTDDEMRLRAAFAEYADLCRVERGLFNRWPGGAGGSMSHDELMGMAYVSVSLAHEVLDYLEFNDGVYVNILADKATYPDWQLRFNLFRMVFLQPFLKARAGGTLNILSQAILAGHLVIDACGMTREKGIADQGGRLRIWIMLEAIEQSGWIARAAAALWKIKMNRLGLSPRLMLSIEPASCPVLSEYGSTQF